LLKKDEKGCQTFVMEQMVKTSFSEYLRELLSEMKKVESLSMTLKRTEKKSVLQNEDEEVFEMHISVVLRDKPQHLLSFEI
jgi:hypothetical protein